MDVFIYQAALSCVHCGEAQRRHLDQAFKDNDAMPGEDNGDSDRYPQGPYPNGGGEADSPQHCDACGVFLENPLTPDGYQYVDEAIARHAIDGWGDREVLKTWAKFYGRPDDF
jgi:hypothetical protein